MNFDEDYEEKAMLMQASQGMIEFRAGELVAGKNLDVLLWWSQHEKLFPMLSKIVRKYFCIEATSCSAERTFSTGGTTVTAKRSKLEPDNVNMLVYLRENLGKNTLKSLCLKMKKRKELKMNAWLKRSEMTN